MDWNKLADDNTIEETKNAFNSNGFNVVVVKNSEEAKNKVLELVPKGAEVMAMTSVTLNVTGIDEVLNDSENYNSLRKKLMSMDRKTQGREMNKLGCAPEYAIGSVQALSKDGHVMIASASGSQLPAYAYGANKVIWVVGAQKIVETKEEGFKRIYEHCFPLENQRALKVYGKESSVNKILVLNKEPIPNRSTIIIVKEVLGF
ncbi:MAG: lactate utilization protein [Patescibacteria group bacterium]|nr:lactate utilization protein [Patescibacteria group bacterium]